jgi:hypothetical protein
MQKIARNINILNEKALFLFIVLMTAAPAHAAVRFLPGELPEGSWLPRLMGRMFDFLAGLAGQIAASGVMDMPPGVK